MTLVSANTAKSSALITKVAVGSETPAVLSLLALTRGYGTTVSEQLVVGIATPKL